MGQYHIEVMNVHHITYAFTVKTKNTYRAFNIYSFVPLTGGQQPECIFCDYPLTIQNIFLQCSDTFPARNLLFGNVQTMHDLFTIFDVHVLIQFLQECDFLQQNLNVLFVYMLYAIFVIFFMSVEWDVKWCPVSRITNSWHTKDRFSGFRRRTGS